MAQLVVPRGSGIDYAIQSSRPKAAKYRLRSRRRIGIMMMGQAVVGEVELAVKMARQLGDIGLEESTVVQTSRAGRTISAGYHPCREIDSHYFAVANQTRDADQFAPRTASRIQQAGVGRNPRRQHG